MTAATTHARAREPMTLRGDRNQCCGCGEYFNSLAAFDKHRSGAFGRDRRCLDPQEMIAKGRAKNASDWWITAPNPWFQEEQAC